MNAYIFLVCLAVDCLCVCLTVCLCVCLSVSLSVSVCVQPSLVAHPCSCARECVVCLCVCASVRTPYAHRCSLVRVRARLQLWSVSKGPLVTGMDDDLLEWLDAAAITPAASTPRPPRPITPEPLAAAAAGASTRLAAAGASTRLAPAPAGASTRLAAAGASTRLAPAPAGARTREVVLPRFCAPQVLNRMFLLFC